MFKKAKILIIGDLMLDHYVYGVVNRVSPEAPVPVLDVEKEEEFLGGAGVVASNLLALGARVQFLSVVGDDPAAVQVRTLLSAQGVPCIVVSEKGRKTTMKKRFIKTQPSFEMLLRADSETRQDIKATTESALLDMLEKAAEGADFLIISDYAKGMLTKNLIGKILAFSRANGKHVVVDTKGDISAYGGDNVILVPNLHELGAASRKEMANEDAGVRAAALALSKSSGSMVVVKRSGKGASIADGKSGTFRTCPSMAKDVVNVSGAGDIFVAIFTLALASGKNMDEAVKLANLGCAKAIAKQHPSITAAELG